jgi:hypothetical protein
MNANSSQHSFKYGSITCFESIIASTVGSEVFLRDVKHSTFFLVIPSLILTDSLKIPPSRPLHLRTIFRCLMSLGSHTFISCQERDSLSFSCKSLKCTWIRMVAIGVIAITDLLVILIASSSTSQAVPP